MMTGKKECESCWAFFVTRTTRMRASNSASTSSLREKDVNALLQVKEVSGRRSALDSDALALNGKKSGLGQVSKKMAGLVVELKKEQQDV